MNINEAIEFAFRGGWTYRWTQFPHRIKIPEKNNG